MTDPASDRRDDVVTFDPVCGQVLEPDAAVASVEHGGRTFYFGHIRCKMLFEKQPESYLRDGLPTVAPQEVSPSSAPPRPASRLLRRTLWAVVGTIAAACLVALYLFSTKAPTAVKSNVADKPIAAATPLLTPQVPASAPSVKTDSERAVELFELGRRRLVEENKVDEAIEALEASIKLAPTNAAAHAALGAAYRRQSRNREAVKELVTYLRLAPDAHDSDRVQDLLSATVHALAAEAEPTKKPSKRDSVAGEMRAEREAKAPKTTPREQLELGHKYLAAKNVEAAIAAYRYAIRLKPTFAEAHAALATAYDLKGWHAMAADALLTYLRLSKEQATQDTVPQLVEEYQHGNSTPESR